MDRLIVDAEYASPYACSAFVALREKGVPFELEAVDLIQGQQQTPEFRSRALTWRVPTLVRGSFTLTESSAIAEFIDEMHLGTRLYPQNPQHRARVRQVQAWLRSDLAALRQERSTEIVFLGGKGGPLSPPAAAAAAKLLAVAGQLIAPGQLFLCPQWSIADVDLAVMLNRLIFNGDEVPAHLRDYAAAQWLRPSVAEWVALPRA